MDENRNIILTFDPSNQAPLQGLQALKKIQKNNN